MWYTVLLYIVDREEGVVRVRIENNVKADRVRYRLPLDIIQSQLRRSMDAPFQYRKVAIGIRTNEFGQPLRNIPARQQLLRLQLGLPSTPPLKQEEVTPKKRSRTTNHKTKSKTSNSCNRTMDQVKLSSATKKYNGDSDEEKRESGDCSSTHCTRNHFNLSLANSQKCKDESDEEKGESSDRSRGRALNHHNLSSTAKKYNDGINENEERSESSDGGYDEYESLYIDDDEVDSE